MRKFEIGDKVRFSNRIPKVIRNNYQGRTRTITDVRYKPELQACIYILDNRSIYVQDNRFRSYELVLAPKNRLVGRPRKKRTYNKKSNWWNKKEQTLQV